MKYVTDSVVRKLQSLVMVIFTFSLLLTCSLHPQILVRNLRHLKKRNLRRAKKNTRPRKSTDERKRR